MAQHVRPEHLVERRVELVGVDVGDALVEVEDPDAVDQRVEPAEGSHRGGDGLVVGLA